MPSPPGPNTPVIASGSQTFPNVTQTVPAAVEYPPQAPEPMGPQWTAPQQAYLDGLSTSLSRTLGLADIQGAVTLEQFAPQGTVFDGSKDATSYWQAALAAAAAAVVVGTGPKAILLGANREYPTTAQLDVAAGVEIIGQGDSSVVSTPADINVFRVQGEQVTFANFLIKGNGVGVNQIGIANQPVGSPAGSGFHRVRILNVSFSQLATAGVLTYQLPGGAPLFTTFMLNPRIENCGIGLWFLGEYSTIIGMQISGCNVGVDIEGGNQVYVGGSITSCTQGIKLDAGGNDAHGVWLGVEVNHCTKVMDTTGATLVNTQYFRDCEFYYGAFNVSLTTQPSAPIILDACQMDPESVVLGAGANVIWQGCNWSQQTIPGPPPFTVPAGAKIRFDAMNTDGTGQLPAFIQTLVGATTTAYINLLQGITQILPPVAAPASPAAGFLLYVDAADGKLKAKGSGGTVTILALP